MAAPQTADTNPEKHNPLTRRGRGGYALPKGSCANRSEWRLPPGKPAERLSPHYRLDCDFGTSLVFSWKNDGTEPIYVCEAHAKELGFCGEGWAGGDKPAGQAGSTKQKEASRQKENQAMAGLMLSPKKAPPAPSNAENGARAERRPKESAQPLAERRAAIDRQISECAAQLEQMLSQSQSTINAAETIDAALERATLEIIANPAMSETQKDATIQQLGELQESLKQDTGQEMTPLKAYETRQAVKERLSGKSGASGLDEGHGYERLLYESLERAIHGAVPEAKELEERLADLNKTKSEMEKLPHAKELSSAVA